MFQYVVSFNEIQWKNRVNAAKDICHFVTSLYKCIQNFSRKVRREDTTWNNLGVDGKITLERIFEKQDGEVWNGCICFMIGTTGRFL